jgi:small GTP-binding protein
MEDGGSNAHTPQKVLVIGDSAVGKSCLISTYVAKRFQSDYLTTLGVDFALKTLNTDDGKQLRLHLWDVAGQERFGQLIRVYYKKANACIVVFDLTRRLTFDNVRHWKADLDDKVTKADGSPIPCILLANKSDLKHQRAVTKSEIEELCKECNFLSWHETSAKENTGIDEAIHVLVDELLRDITSDVEEDQSGRIRVTDTAPKQTDPNACAC